MTPPTGIDWQITPTDWIVLRTLIYLRFGIFYGFGLFVLGVAVVFLSNVEGQTASIGILLGVSLTTCLFALAVARKDTDRPRSVIGRYLSVAGSQSSFEVWTPATLFTLAFVGSIGITLAWVTEIFPTILLVSVPITVRIVEGAFVALVPLAGSVHRETQTYIRRVNYSAEETVAFDLSKRSLVSAWSFGEVTLCWFTGAGPPIFVPLPNEHFRELEIAFESSPSVASL